MTSITLRWAGPADATDGSSYLIERTTDNVSFLTLAFPQAATSPYVSPLSTLSGNTDYGNAAINEVGAGRVESGKPPESVAMNGPTKFE
jgi:hypothetical protein